MVNLCNTQEKPYLNVNKILPLLDISFYPDSTTHRNFLDNYGSNSLSVYPKDLGFEENTSFGIIHRVEKPRDIFSIRLNMLNPNNYHFYNRFPYVNSAHIKRIYLNKCYITKNVEKVYNTSGKTLPSDNNSDVMKLIEKIIDLYMKDSIAKSVISYHHLSWILLAILFNPTYAVYWNIILSYHVKIPIAYDLIHKNYSFDINKLKKPIIGSILLLSEVENYKHDLSCTGCIVFSFMGVRYSIDYNYFLKIIGAKA